MKALLLVYLLASAAFLARANEESFAQAPPLLAPFTEANESITDSATTGEHQESPHFELNHHAHHHHCIHDTPEMLRGAHGFLPLPSVGVITSANGNETGSYQIIELGRRNAARSFRPRLVDEEDASNETNTDTDESTSDPIVQGPEEVLTTVMMPQPYPSPSARRLPSGRRDTTNDQPIRIVFRTLDLDDTNHYCTTSGEQKTDMNSNSKITCTAEDVLTTEKKNFLRNVVLTRAGQVLSSILNVERMVSNLRAAATTVCNTYFTVPASDVTTGVPNADLVVYVAAAPTGGSTIAWASFCQLDQNGRPVVARTNFSPKYLAPAHPMDLESVIRTGVHELIHALGFSSTYIKSSNFGTANAITTGTKRRGGQPVTLYTGPSAVNAAREQFACWTTNGIELEDEGGSGTTGSHWERRTHKEDVMAGIVGDVMTLSAMTFGVLEDSGHYSLTRSSLETERHMRYAGCGVFDTPCNTASGGNGRYFCAEGDGSATSVCTADYSGLGYCNTGTYTSDLPVWGRYFANRNRFGGISTLMNYCPIVVPYSNRRCNRYDNAEANNSAIALYFGSDGRCFATTGTLYKGVVGPDNGPSRCLRARCPGGVRIEFQVGDSASWVQCPTDGTAGDVDAPSPYTGKISCPYASDLCTADLMFGVAQPTSTLAIGETLAPRPTSTRAPNTASSQQFGLAGIVVALFVLKTVVLETITCNTNN